MHAQIVDFLSNHINGLFGLSGWVLAAISFACIQVSMMAVTLYLHRDQSHRAIKLHPMLRHFFRLWVWLTSGMETRAWVAVHRKHHAMCETAGDPHSPVVFGLRRILLEGAEVYRLEARNPETLEKFGHGCPNDWLERTFYARGYLGIYVTLVIDILLFGALGITMFAFQMLTMPVLAAGGINGLGHALGYRNFETDDASTNMVPIGLLIGGEELHNNHHAFPTSAKFSVRKWEFDIGWFYICVMRALGLCKVTRVAPAPLKSAAPRPVDTETLRAVLHHKMHVMRDFTRRVTLPVLRLERDARGSDALMQRARALLLRWPGHLDDTARRHLARVLEVSPQLRTVQEYRRQLTELWQQANVSNERLVRELREWCARAETSGIHALQEFSARLRGYVPQPA